MLKNLNRNDEVISSVELLGQGLNLEVWPNRLMGLPNGVFGNINPVGLDAFFPECFNEETLCTPCIKDSCRPNSSNHSIRDISEKLKPIVGSDIIRAAAVGIVVFAETLIRNLTFQGILE